MKTWKKVSLVICLLGVSVVGFAQRLNLDEQIRQASNTLSGIVNSRGFIYVSDRAKSAILRDLNDAIQLATNRPDYPPQNNLPGAMCAWYDGSQVSPRGVHATRTVNGQTISLGYYENNSGVSLSACWKDLIFKYDSDRYYEDVARAKVANCTCAWYDGATIGPRGWHMAYSVRLDDGETITISSAYFDNNGGDSQTACGRAYAANGFSCR